MSFPHINQFYQVLTSMDHDGITQPLPFIGTVKLDGANMSISLTRDGKYEYHSRTDSVTDIAFNFDDWAITNKDRIVGIIQDQFFKWSYGLHPIQKVTIYGEWCGQGIQKRTAISKLSKRWVVFQTLVEYEDDVYPTPIWLRSFCSYFNDPSINLFNVYNYPTYSVTVDPQNPSRAAEVMEKFLKQVEEEDPIAKSMGEVGIGEGIVWVPERFFDGGGRYWFKTKGEKHKVTKTKEAIEIAPEVLASIEEFVGATVTENRLNQAWAMSVGKQIPAITLIGPFLKWISTDIAREEAERLEVSGLDWKQVNGRLTTVAKEWFKRKIEESVGL